MRKRYQFSIIWPCSPIAAWGGQYESVSFFLWLYTPSLHSNLPDMFCCDIGMQIHNKGTLQHKLGAISQVSPCILVSTVTTFICGGRLNLWTTISIYWQNCMRFSWIVCFYKVESSKPHLVEHSHLGQLPCLTHTQPFHTIQCGTNTYCPSYSL